MKHTVTELTLKNGAKGLLIHIPDATVMSFEFNFRAGDYLVKREKWETPHLMEHVLLGANELLPKSRLFQAEFEKNGAYSNASTGAYDITYEAESADFEWDRILGLMLTAMTKPLFLADEYEAEFGSVREELTARSNNHFRRLNLTLQNAIGFRALTDHERLVLMDNVTLDDIKQHYSRTHTTSNMRFIIAGKLPPERRKVMAGLLEAMELPTGDGRLDLPNERPVRLDTALYIHNETVENLYFYVDTFMHHRLDDAETDALGLANILLTETFYSRILGTAREKGLVYHVSSGFGYTKDSSNWWLGSQVMPKNAAKLFALIASEILAVRKGKVGDDEIQSAKQFALGRFQRGAQTVGGTASGYAPRYYFDDYIDDYYKVPERIEAVTREGVESIMHQMFAEDTWGLGVLGNAGEEFAEELRSRIRGLW